MFNRMTLLGILILASEVIIGSACSQEIPASGYSFEHPDAVFELPKSLSEISGLTLLDDRHLGAIHDESDKLFVIDLAKGEVKEKHDIGRERDYEGIERVGSEIYVLSSGGVIYEIRDWPNNKRISEKYETNLDMGHDTEGLAYDAVSRRLLIACKEYPGKGMKGYKAIYAFDLANKKLIPEPLFKIDLVQADEAAKTGRVGPAGIKKEVSWWKRKKEIKPAALAVHPLTGQLFVISSTKRRLIILNTDGSLAAAFKLPKKHFAQPEGMAFLPNGDLFISNEQANRKSATLLRFNYRRSP